LSTVFLSPDDLPAQTLDLYLFPKMNICFEHFLLLEPNISSAVEHSIPSDGCFLDSKLGSCSET
jgi:hypothetical protein